MGVCKNRKNSIKKILRAIYRKFGKILNYLHDTNVIRVFTGTSIYLLLYVNDVSSDFISKGRKSFAFPNFPLE
jgi:hypothetical protein